jgi:hypothetical protein
MECASQRHASAEGVPVFVEFFQYAFKRADAIEHRVDSSRQTELDLAAATQPIQRV